jgi:DNA-binding transcriptional regulator LsrR (DeoR family)
MHFLGRQTNLAIADALNVSRWRVARLIQLALDEGLVTISVSTPAVVDDDLSGELVAAFGLVDALVIPTFGDGNDVMQPDTAIGRLAAAYLSSVVESGATVGVAWGRTMNAVADGLSLVERLPRCDVVQMMGGVPGVQPSLQSIDLVRRVVEQTRGGVAYAIHAPLCVADRSTAKTLRADRSVALTLEKLGHLDVAVVGIGSWQPPNSRLIEVLPDSDRAELDRLDVMADVATVLFDRRGKVIESDFGQRTIAVTWADLKAARQVIAVAHGADKVKAIYAVLRADFVNVLVTDSATAQGLLELASA